VTSFHRSRVEEGVELKSPGAGERSYIRIHRRCGIAIAGTGDGRPTGAVPVVEGAAVVVGYLVRYRPEAVGRGGFTEAGQHIAIDPSVLTLHRTVGIILGAGNIDLPVFPISRVQAGVAGYFHAEKIADGRLCRTWSSNLSR